LLRRRGRVSAAQRAPVRHRLGTGGRTGGRRAAPRAAPGRRWLGGAARGLARGAPADRRRPRRPGGGRTASGRAAAAGRRRAAARRRGRWSARPMKPWLRKAVLGAGFVVAYAGACVFAGNI